MPLDRNLIENIASGPEPTIPRARLLHKMIRQINQLTLTVAPPRMADQERQRSGESLRAQFQAESESRNTVDGVPMDEPLATQSVVYSELRRTTSTVRVEDPDDSSVYVDVERIERVLMVGTDGRTIELQFNNTGA